MKFGFNSLVFLFYSKVKSGPFCFCTHMGRCLNCRFLRNYWSCEVEVGTYGQINEYMKIYDNPRSRPFIDLYPRSLRFNIFKLLFLKTPGYWSQISYTVSMWWMLGMKICSTVPGHMNKMVSRPIYETHLQKTSSEPRGRWPRNLIYSIEHSSTPNMFKLWPWDHDQLYDIKFCFLMLLHG